MTWRWCMIPGSVDLTCEGVDGVFTGDFVASITCESTICLSPDVWHSLSADAGGDRASCWFFKWSAVDFCQNKKYCITNMVDKILSNGIELNLILELAERNNIDLTRDSSFPFQMKEGSQLLEWNKRKKLLTNLRKFCHQKQVYIQHCKDKDVLHRSSCKYDHNPRSQ